MDKAKLDRQSSKPLSRKIGNQIQRARRRMLTCLPPAAAQTLTTFFSGKLDDNSCLTYCLHGLTRLTQSPAFGSGEGAQVAQGSVSLCDRRHRHPPALISAWL